MSVLIELCDDTKTNIIAKDLKAQIQHWNETLDEMCSTKTAEGYASWDYKEDKKAVEKLIKALETVGEYYGVKL
jgi:mannitol/fructose-specific phosphotransferase system IIA component (Ntr-type)